MPSLTPPQPPASSTVIQASGTLACQDLLFDRLDSLLENYQTQPDFRSQIWLVVPTRVLLRHLQHRTVERLGATLGLRFWTLGALVRSLIANDRHHSEANKDRSSNDEDPTGDDLLFEILATRHLAELRDTSFERARGPGGALRDLVDAGLEIEHLGSVIEQLGDAEVSGEDIQRAEQLLIACGKTLQAAEQAGIFPARLRYARATQTLDQANQYPNSSGNPSSLLVYGFADLTGTGADFLQTLVNRFHGTVILNRPPEPDAATPIPAIDRYLQRWQSRLAPPILDSRSAASPTVTVFRAAKPAEEMRGIGTRIRTLLEQGITPSSIGVVLRQPLVYALPALNELSRLEIPCSAPGLPGFLLPSGRRIRALCDLLDHGEAAPLDRWLDARWEAGSWEASALETYPCDDPDSGIPTFEIRRRLALTGLRTLGHLARLEVDNESDSSTEGGRQAKWCDEASQILSLLHSWRSGAGVDHAHQLAQLIKLLRWPEEEISAIDIDSRLQPLELELSFDEFRYWLKRSTEDDGRTDSDPWTLGGVRILRIQDARDVTFSHLFIPGMSRGLFPRAIQGDAELREELRELLAGGLVPDLPLASRFHDEERYLFAQLLSAAPTVTLSHSERNLDERLMPRSSLLSLLPAETTTQIPRGVPGPQEPEFAQSWSTLSPFQRRIQAGLWSRNLQGEELSAASIAVLDEYNRDGPSPYLGWIGPSEDAGDRRNRTVYVTRLEGYARCPWQTYLRNFLKLRQRQDPDLVAPDLPPLAVGAVVHDLLKDIAIADGVPSGPWRRVAENQPQAMTWPDQDVLQEMVVQAAHNYTNRQGVRLPGYAETLAHAVAATLQRAQAADLQTKTQVVAVESEGVAQFDRQTVAFRVDRLEMRDGALLATDFKTGSRAQTGRPATQIGKAQWLQLPTYLLGGAEQAQLLFIGDRDHPQGLEVGLGLDDTKAVETFRELAATLSQGWRQGRFFPRVLTHSGSRPRTCTWCEFAEACSERDPFARNRVKEAVEADGPANGVWKVGVG